MSLTLSNAKSLLTDQILDEMNTQLKKLKKNLDLNVFKIEISTNKLDISNVNYSNIIHETKAWEDLAKLSIDLYKDYDYYRQFLFTSRYDNSEYINRLKALGFVYENNKWRSASQPKIKDVQMNVFMYFLFRSMSNIMMKKVKMSNKEVVIEEKYPTYKTCDDSSIVLPSLSKDKKRSSIDSVDKWSCPSCTYKNKWDNKMCEICFMIQDSVTDLVKGTKGAWECNYCKCENFPDKYICRKCHKDAPFFHKWICKKCQFFNDNLAECCEACLISNEHLSTCNICKKNIVNVIESTVCNTCENTIDLAQNVVSCVSGRSYCDNRWCGYINTKISDHCQHCKLKNGSKIHASNKMDVHDGQKYVKKWQCTFCGRFNDKIKCIKCRNMHLSTFYKLCPCNWVNRSVATHCDKCFKVLP